MQSIVIPAYNEELRIKRTLDDYTRAFKDAEFIVVCDGIDRTSQVVRKLMKHDKRVRLIISKRRLGKGGAIYRGFDDAKNNIIGFTDSDESVSPEDYARLVEELKTYDCVIASRRTKGARIIKNRPWHIVFVSYVFNKIVNLFFGLGLKDTQCGAKVMRKEVYEKIKKELHLTGFEFDVELLWRVKKAGFKIKEVPITWTYKKQSKFGIKYWSKMFFNLLNLRFS